VYIFLFYQRAITYTILKLYFFILKSIDIDFSFTIGVMFVKLQLLT